MNKKIIYFIAPILIIIAAAVIIKTKGKGNQGESVREISHVFGSIQTLISTTGTVLPKNRLEIKPPVNGRIESVLVKEGERVKTGQALAWMSSTERAELFEAERARKEEKKKKKQ